MAPSAPLSTTRNGWSPDNSRLLYYRQTGCLTWDLTCAVRQHIREGPLCDIGASYLSDIAANMLVTLAATPLDFLIKLQLRDARA